MKRINLGHFGEHLAIGAGSYAALFGIDNRQHYAVGLSGAALVAAFKEGTDAFSGRDTRKQAIFHALTIMAGAGLVEAFWHR